MNFALTPEQIEIQARVRDFAQSRVMPLAREMDERGEVPRWLIDEMAQSGFLGGPLPLQYGGSAWDALSLALCYEELGRADSSVRGLMTVHTSLVSQSILAWAMSNKNARIFPGSRAANGSGAIVSPNRTRDRTWRAWKAPPRSTAMTM